MAAAQWARGAAQRETVGRDLAAVQSGCRDCVLLDAAGLVRRARRDALATALGADYAVLWVAMDPWGDGAGAASGEPLDDGHVMLWVAHRARLLARLAADRAAEWRQTLVVDCSASLAAPHLAPDAGQIVAAYLCGPLEEALRSCEPVVELHAVPHPAALGWMLGFPVLLHASTAGTCLSMHPLDVYACKTADGGTIVGFSVPQSADAADAARIQAAVSAFRDAFRAGAAAAFGAVEWTHEETSRVSVVL